MEERLLLPHSEDLQIERVYGPLEPALFEPFPVDPTQVGPRVPLAQPVLALDLPLPARSCCCHGAVAPFGLATMKSVSLCPLPATLAEPVRPALPGLAFGFGGRSWAIVPRGTTTTVARGEAPGADSAGASPM